MLETSLLGDIERVSEDLMAIFGRGEEGGSEHAPVSDPGTLECPEPLTSFSAEVVVGADVRHVPVRVEWLLAVSP